jgi:hypothetical protein
VTSDDDRIAYLSGDHDSELLDADERDELDEVRALLADPSLWIEPPAGLEHAVVAAIADQVDANDAIAQRAVANPAIVAPPDARTGRARPRLAGWLVGAAAAAAIAVGAAAVLGARDRSQPSLAASLAPTDLSPGARGEATFERTDSGWRIELDGTGLPRRADGTFYEAWLRNDAGTLVSIGTFNEPADVVLWAGVSPLEFPTLTVTREAADGDPSSSGERVLTGAITER